MQCIVCKSELSGRKQRFCSDKCRKAYSRTNSDKSNVEVGQMSELQQSRTASLEDYYAHPEDYVKRRDPPETLNWGKPMTFDELQSSPYKGNRVPIPGDWDYEGVCVKINGEWKLRSQVST